MWIFFLYMYSKDTPLFQLNIIILIMLLISCKKYTKTNG